MWLSRKRVNILFTFTFLAITQKALLAEEIISPLRKEAYRPSFFPPGISRVLLIRREYLKEEKNIYRELRSLWMASEDFSEVRFITYLEDLISVSPDGTMIVFNNTDGLSFLYDLAQATIKNLPQVHGKILWSADARSLFFQQGINGLFRLEVDSGRVEKLLDLEKTGKFISSSGKAYLGAGSIKLADIHQDRIIFVRKSIEVESPIRAGVSFTLEDDYIWEFNIINGKLACLGKGTEPEFSPDGRLIVFRDEGQLWVVSVEDRIRWKLSTGGNAVFSPDGKKIAFVDKGFDGTRFHWRNLWLADLESREARAIPVVSNWTDFVVRFIPRMQEIFRKDPYFTESNPDILWFPDGNKLIYTVGWNTFFVADLHRNQAEPFLVWDIQTEPRIHYLMNGGESMILTCAFISTSRRKSPPMSAVIASGWLREYDIWQFSLKDNSKKMLLENGSNPVPVIRRQL